MSLHPLTQPDQRKRPSRHAKLPRRTYTLQEAEHISGLGMTTLYALIRDGRLRSIKVGARRLLIAESFDAMLSGDAA
jgi:excisionase family DNA binding protein